MMMSLLMSYTEQQLSKMVTKWVQPLENFREGWFYSWVDMQRAVLVNLSLVCNILNTHYTHKCVIHFWCKTSLIWVKSWVFTTSHFTAGSTNWFNNHWAFSLYKTTWCMHQTLCNYYTICDVYHNMYHF